MSQISIHDVTAIARERLARVAQIEALPPQPARHEGNQWQLGRKGRHSIKTWLSTDRGLWTHADGGTVGLHLRFAAQQAKSTRYASGTIPGPALITHAVVGRHQLTQTYRIILSIDGIGTIYATEEGGYTEFAAPQSITIDQPIYHPSSAILEVRNTDAAGGFSQADIIIFWRALREPRAA